MLDKIRNFFSSDVDSHRDISAEAESVRLIVVSVLVAAAHSDGTLSQAESQMIADLAERKLGLSESSVSKVLHKQTQDTELASALSDLKDKLTISEREQILSFAWAIIGADSKVANPESSFAANLRTLLGLSMEQALRAREGAEQLNIHGMKEFLEASPQVVEDTKRWVTNGILRPKK